MPTRSARTSALIAATLLLVACTPGLEETDAGQLPSDAPGTPAPPTAAAERRVIATTDAPEALGPYSQAILVGPTLYLAGQLGMDPSTGDIVAGGIEAETRRALENLGAVLRAAGFDFEDVVQSQVFLADLEEFDAMNAVYAEYFSEAPPARATVEVARIPRDGRIEIMFTAVRNR